MKKMINKPCVITIIFLVLTLFNKSAAETELQHYTRSELAHIAGYGEESLSSVLVTGSVLCDACLDAGFDYRTSYIAGAKVAVACKYGWEGRKKMTWVRGTTDDYGDFIVDLPSRLHGIPELEAACTVRVLQIPRKSSCHRAYGIKPAEIRLSSVGNSIRVYTTGAVRLVNQRKPFHRCINKGDDHQGSVW